MIKSRFRFFVSFYYFFSVGLVSLSIYLFFHPEAFKKGPGDIEVTSVVVPIIFLFLACYLFYIISKRAIIIILRSDIVKLKGLFKRKPIYKEEIQSINLFSKLDMYWSAGVTTIATEIVLANGEKFFIADLFYRNIGEIKLSLYNLYRDKIINYPLKARTASGFEIQFAEPQKFAGNPFTSLNGLLVVGFTAAMLYVIFTLNRPLVYAHFFLLMPIAMIYLGFGYSLHYFVITKDELIVRSHFLPWIKKKYELETIIEANFEQHYRSSRSLRITTNDFKTKAYQAGSLREKHWNNLRERLIDLNILFVEI